MKTKEQKRKEAQQRQVDRSKRTNKEQIEKLDREGWKATRERQRLNK